MATLVWEPILKDVISEVLETMFFSMVEFEHTGGPLPFDYGTAISIFNHSGRVEISMRLSGEFATQLTANLLGIGEEEVAEDDLKDTIGEFANMVGGGCHARMKDREWRLGIPRAWKIVRAEAEQKDDELVFGCDGQPMGSAILEFVPLAELQN